MKADDAHYSYTNTFPFTLLLYFSHFRKKERPIRTISIVYLVPTSSYTYMIQKLYGLG